jgi:hypothetical protein
MQSRERLHNSLSTKSAAASSKVLDLQKSAKDFTDVRGAYGEFVAARMNARSSKTKTLK